MGYTKIKAVKNHLARCLDYTSNPVKTERFSEEDLGRLLDYTQNRDKTEHQLYVTGFNCDPANACDTMNATRKRWGKDGEGHVLAYHVIQSFKPGEVTPEQAHNIGCEFARRYLAERYEVTVSTHLDKSHLHNHIVFNSVAFVDGKMYRNQFRDYYRGIRQISDDLCRENRLKVIDPKGHGKNYAEWAAEKAGRPTVRGTIKADVDRALKGAVNWTTFVLTLNQMGYEVSYGHNVKYAKLRPKGSQRAIRFKSLGPGYSEQELRARLEQPKNDTASRMGQRERAAPLVHKKVLLHGSYRKHTHKKITGFMATICICSAKFRSGRPHHGKRIFCCGRIFAPLNGISSRRSSFGKTASKLRMISTKNARRSPPKWTGWLPDGRRCTSCVPTPPTV